MALFPNSLKFKHHVLIHYPDLFFKFGPIGNMECSIYERLHRYGEITSYNAISRVNPCHTVAVKNQLKFSNLLRNSKRQIESFTTAPLSKILNIETDSNYRSFAHCLPAGVMNVCLTSSVK